MKRHIFIIAITLCLMACAKHSEHWNKLAHVESFINETPDSALNVLRDIDTDELTGDEEVARHALLLSMALDKNYIDETDDSLISIAKDYYEDTNDIKNQFLSLYYYGRVLYNRGDYSDAIVVYTTAESQHPKPSTKKVKKAVTHKNITKPDLLADADEKGIPP
mgnify:CR=1 FL=1